MCIRWERWNKVEDDNGTGDVDCHYCVRCIRENVSKHDTARLEAQEYHSHVSDQLLYPTMQDTIALSLSSAQTQESSPQVPSSNVQSWHRLQAAFILLAMCRDRGR